MYELFSKYIRFIRICENIYRSTPVAEVVKNQPIGQEMQVRSLGWEDSLKKGMTTHSSILAWEIPWGQEPVGLQVTGVRKESDMTERLHARTQIYILWLT